MKDLLEKIASLTPMELEELEKAAVCEVENAKKRLTLIRMLRDPSAKPSTYRPRSSEQKKPERDNILPFIDDYFLSNGNMPVSVRELTRLILEAGIKIAGDRPGTTVGAFMARAGKYKCEKGKWTSGHATRESVG